MHGPRSERATLYRMVPALAQSLRALDDPAKRAGLDPVLLELLKLRVSQINGWVFCLQFHANDLAKLPHDPARPAQLAAWRESPVFSAEERAALGYAEALTRLAPDGVPDATYDAAQQVFGEAGLAALTAAVVAINGWNRVAIAYRFVPPPASGDGR